MGSMIELNYVLQLTHEQGFPKELDLAAHLQSPISFDSVKDKVFSFTKPRPRIYHTPPVHVFLAENIIVNGVEKWVYWGQVEILEQMIDSNRQTTSGKFKIVKLFTPEEMRQAEKIIFGPAFKTYHYFAGSDSKTSANLEGEDCFSSDVAIKFKYVNWQGETGIRTVKPIKLWFGTTEFHKGQHWFLKAFDLDKQAERDYAIEDIIKIYPVEKGINSPNRKKASSNLNNEAIL